MKKILCIALLVFLLFVSTGFAQEIPTMQKYVNDFANVLTDADESRINALCAEIEKNWTIEIAVLTVNTTQPMTVEEYAVKTFEKNGIGKADKDNGLLIVAAIEDRKWRFEVGYGLEPIINDAKAGRIGRAYLTPYFQEENYGDGLYYAVDAVAKVIQNSGDDSFISEQSYPSEDVTSIAVVLIVLSIMFLPFIFLILNFASAEKCPNCGARMKCHYDDDYANFRYSNRYIVCECPKCGKKIRKKNKRKSSLWFFVGGFGGRGGGGFSGGGGFGGGGSGGGGSSGGW